MGKSDFTAVVIPAKGFSDVCAQEIEAIIGSKAAVNNGVCVFSTESILKICEYIYMAGTPSKVLLYIADIESGADLIGKLGDKIKSLKLPIKQGQRFVLRASSDDLRIDRQELESEIGGSITEATKAIVDFKNPDFTVYAHIQEGRCWFGLDLCGEDLGKRDYRVFLGPQALKGNIAASLVMLSGFGKGKTLLDLFCRNGIITIEAALIAMKASPHRFGKEKFLFRRLPLLNGTDWENFFAKIDKASSDTEKSVIIAMDPQFGSISAAKKNAKIAGANKQITFSRTDLEFLDAKFGKHAIDCLVTLTPQIRSGTPEEKVKKIIKELFYQAEFVVKNGGNCVLITQTAEQSLKEQAVEYKFRLKEERIAFQGEARFTVLVFER